MADSVVNGNFRIWYWSSLLTRGTERRRYLGLRSRRSVFGLWNFGLKYTLVDFFVLEPTARVLAAFFALSAGALALGAMLPAEERRQAQNGMERCLLWWQGLATLRGRVQLRWSAQLGGLRLQRRRGCVSSGAGSSAVLAEASDKRSRSGDDVGRVPGPSGVHRRRLGSRIYNRANAAPQHDR
jgi:hypothetical protein